MAKRLEAKFWRTASQDPTDRGHNQAIEEKLEQLGYQTKVIELGYNRKPALSTPETFTTGYLGILTHLGLI